jgi:hypothetical protein
MSDFKTPPPAPMDTQPVTKPAMPLVITKEWFERRAKAEADLEIGADFSIVNVTDADAAQMELLAERALPQWAQDELARLRAALATGGEEL